LIFGKRYHCAAMFLKKAAKTAMTDEASTRAVVQKLLKQIEEGREVEVAKLCSQLDKYEGDILLTPESWEEAIKEVPQQVRQDIEFSHARVKGFAEKQFESLTEFECEFSPGVFAGQKVLPITTAGCYVPGGRYAHIASAIMTVTTARVAGVKHVVVASPTRTGGGVAPAVLYAAKICGADKVLACGGVQAIASLKHGLFTGCPAEVIVGPGNKYVAEAKRALFDNIGIDMIAGPTESAVICDESADPEMAAIDMVSQAEHGINSPCWIISTSERVAKACLEAVPRLIALLPTEAREAAEASWRDYGEIYVATDREDAVRQSDLYAPDHLEVHCSDLDWWLKNLQSYGSLFVGEETCITYEDKCSGPNHVLPTMGAARYTGGLNVHKFLKVCSYQWMTREANRDLGKVAARISRYEGMEGHARAADARLAKYFPAGQDALLQDAGASGTEHVAAYPPSKKMKTNNGHTSAGVAA